jgi:hypothetical protein
MHKSRLAENIAAVIVLMILETNPRGMVVV